MPELVLAVNGREFRGWTEAEVTRSIETIAGSFRLAVSDRQPAVGGDHGAVAGPWPINAEDLCQLTVAGEVVITGAVDTRSQSFSADEHGFSVGGRDAAGALVDSSAILDQWQFSSIGVLEFCRKVAAPFGVAVTLQDGASDAAVTTSSGGAGKSKKTAGGTPLKPGSAGRSSDSKIGRPNAQLRIEPGESAFEAIDRACRTVGLLPVSDGAGGIILMNRVGVATATTALVQGQNILSAEFTAEETRRYRRYVVMGQSAGTDDDYGITVAQRLGQAYDMSVRRSERVLVVLPEGAVTTAFANKRAQWEAAVRKARSGDLTVKVQGWTQADGALWPVNAVVSVHIPLFGILHRSLLISEATYELSRENGSTTTLKLVAPNAFVPEPVIAASASSALGFLQ